MLLISTPPSDRLYQRQRVGLRRSDDLFIDLVVNVRLALEGNHRGKAGIHSPTQFVAARLKP